MARKTTNIVILGAGFAGVNTYKSLQKYFAGDNAVAIHMVDMQPYFYFSPFLHEVATGSMLPEEVIEPLEYIMGDNHKKYFHQTKVTKIDVHKKQVDTEQGLMPYDYLVVGLGAQSNFFGNEGAAKHSFVLKNVDESLRLKKHLIDTWNKACKAKTKKEKVALLHFVIVGAGLTGVELAAEMAELFFEQLGRKNPELKELIAITMIQAGDTVVPHTPVKIQRLCRKRLEKMGVTIKTGVRVETITKDTVTLNNKDEIATQTVIWTAGVKANPIPFTADFERDRGGRIHVLPSLQIADFREVFVLGDMAWIDNPGQDHPVPGTAQSAAQEGKFVAKNIQAMMTNQPVTDFAYNHLGMFVSLGARYALALSKGVLVRGFPAWVVRRSAYLARFMTNKKRLELSRQWVLSPQIKRDIEKFTYNK